MRKLMLILFALLLCAGIAAAEEPTPAPTSTPVPDLIAQPDATRRPTITATPRPEDAPLPGGDFLANAVEIARRLDMLAESAPYYQYCNRSGATREVWDAVSRGDHTMPAHVFILPVETLVDGLTGGQPETMPWLDLTRTELRRDMVYMLPDMMFVGMEQDVVSCVRMMARFKVFASDEVTGSGLIVLIYEDATPVVGHWYTDNGAVSIAAYFMPIEALEACRTAEDVSAWFAALNMPKVAFEEVTW